MKFQEGIEIRIGIPLPLVCLHHSLFTLVTLESETVNADCYQSVSLSTFSNLYSSLLCSFPEPPADSEFLSLLRISEFFNFI